MSTITVYAFEGWSGEPDTYTTMNYQEAVDRARQNHLRLIALEYEYTDSECLADFTEEA